MLLFQVKSQGFTFQKRLIEQAWLNKVRAFHTEALVRKELMRMETHVHISLDTFQVLHKILKERALGRWKLGSSGKTMMRNGDAIQRSGAVDHDWWQLSKYSLGAARPMEDPALTLSRFAGA
jgi:hypothetical protein